MKQFPIITEITPDVLHGAMDSIANMIAVSFAEWLDGKMMWGHYEGEKLLFWTTEDVRHSGLVGSYSTQELYNIFKQELLCKNVNKAASANSTQKPESHL